MKRKLFNSQNPRHRQFRKNLRNDATNAEKLLWSHLRKKQMVLLFRRQFSIGNYIVDFLCPSLRLIIELDGGYHDEPVQKIKDQIRENKLVEMKYTVIRYKNEQLFNNCDFVLKDIKRNMVVLMQRFHFSEKSWRRVGGNAPTCPSPRV